MLDEIKFMKREPTELEKMSLAELIIYLAMEGYKINFHKVKNDKDNYRALVIELQRGFLDNFYFKNIFIDPKICDAATLSCEYILKSNILLAVSEFDKYDEIKKKVTS